VLYEPKAADGHASVESLWLGTCPLRVFTRNSEEESQLPIIENPPANRHVVKIELIRSKSGVKIERIRARTKIVVTAIGAAVSLVGSVFGFVIWRSFS
jgi:hypothetical protein